MISHVFKGMGRKVGMTSTDGIVIDERLVIRSDASGPKSARMVLQNPRVDFAVFEVARGGILREGLGYERNDVAVVLNVQPDHLGLRGVDTLDQLADVKAVLVEAVPRNGFAVLNADDPLVRKMRRKCSGEVVWFSIAEPGSEVREYIEGHCRRGGRAVVLAHDAKSGKWVGPAFYTLATASVGFQAGKMIPNNPGANMSLWLVNQRAQGFDVVALIAGHAHNDLVSSVAIEEEARWPTAERRRNGIRNVFHG